MRFFVVLSAVLGALAATIQVRDYPTIKADLDVLVTKIGVLRDSINDFPATGGTLNLALEVHQNAVNVDAAMKTAIKDATATESVTHDQAVEALNVLEGLLPTMIEVLGFVESKVKILKELPIAGIPALVKADIAAQSKTTVTFEDVLIKLSPEDLKPRANELSAKINQAYTDALNNIQKTCDELSIKC